MTKPVAKLIVNLETKVTELEGAKQQVEAKLVEKNEALAQRETKITEQKRTMGLLYAYAYEMESEGIGKRVLRKFTGKKELSDLRGGVDIENAVRRLPDPNA